MNNFFEKGLADWGGTLDLELNYAIYAEKNIFMSSVAKSYFGSGIGSGSVMIMSAGTDIKYSRYVGLNNKYMFGWGENRGFIKNNLNEILEQGLWPCLVEITVKMVPFLFQTLE